MNIETVVDLPGKIGKGILFFSVKKANLSDITGVCKGAPLSFQSGISSFKACNSIHAPESV